MAAFSLLQDTLGDRARTLDWSRSPLGHTEQWPQSLRTAVSVALGSAFPAILVWGPERVQIYNDRYAELIGSKHPFAFGMPTHECWPELRAVQEPIFTRVFGGETVHLVDARYVLDRQGSGQPEEAFFTASFSPVLQEDGSVGGSLSILFETTPHVEAKAAAAASDAYMRRVLDQAPLIITTLRGPDHVITSANALSRTVTGLTGDVIGKTVRASQPNLDGSRVHELLDQVYRTGQPHYGNELPVPIDRDGDGNAEMYYFNVTYQPVTADDGTVLGIISVATEVTQIVRARHEAERRAAELEAVVESIPDAVYIGTEAGMSRVNAVALEMLGVPDLATLNAPIDRLAVMINVRDANSGVPIPGDATAFARALRGESAVTKVKIRHGTTGEDRVLRSAANPIRVDGRIVGAVAVNSDVTDQERAEDALRAAVAAAEAANRSKAEFLAVMSHELRTPLHAIAGYVELLQMGLRGPVTDEQKEDLDRIQRSQQHLLGLIGEVLNYAKVETGAVRYQIAAVPVLEVVRGSVSLVAPQARGRGVTVMVGECPPLLSVNADPERLRQILVNLLSNAVKFTPEGGRIDIDMRGDSQSRVARIAVRDTGIGIPADKLETVFEPFVQVNPRSMRTSEGVGLGLAISRNLARGMGGELTATSEMGAGSTFTLELPVA